MLRTMSPRTDSLLPAPNLHLAKARAKLLAREDRQMKADLIDLRQRAGLSQKDVADMLGISQQAINKLERYDSDPKMSTLRRYANAVGALVEHSVTPDLGQSEHLAVAARWKSVATLPQTAIVMPAAIRSGSTSAWAGTSHVQLQVEIVA
jgi:DNA-binding XRE family transcriptional regulator